MDNDVVRPRHLKLLRVLKQWLVLNLPFLLNSILHEVTGRTQKDKDPDNIINHHGLLKLILVRALNHTHIMWEDLIDIDRPLQLEKPEVPQSEILPEIHPRGIEVVQPEGDNAQTEIPATQLEIEIELIKLEYEKSK